MEDELRILLVDDSDEDFLIIKKYLSGRLFTTRDLRRIPYRLDWVSNGDEALQALKENRYQVYLIDYFLGVEDGLTLLKEAEALGREAPLIMLTGQENDQVEIAAARAGAADYLVKNYINELLLERSIRYALERKRTEALLKNEQARLEELVHQRTHKLELTNQALLAEVKDHSLAEEALTQIRDELEIKVRERTDQLQTTNEQLSSVLEQLEAERARLSTIIANAPGAIVVSDRLGNILFANPAADQLFGTISSGTGSLTAGSVRICYPDGHPYGPYDAPLMRSAQQGETQVNLEVLLQQKNGRRRHVLVNAAPILDRKGSIAGAIALYQDITSWKLTEEKARQNATRIEVQRHLMDYRERERLTIAQELHDGPIQDMILTLFLVDEIQSLIQNEDQVTQAALYALRGKVSQLRMDLQEKINSLRSFIGELRPPAVLDFGLDKAILSALEDFQQKNPGLVIQTELSPDKHLLNENHRLALFRIFRELLTNSTRHSRSNVIQILFKAEMDQVILEVRDQGTGFEVPTNWLELAKSGHFGLIGIQERAGAVGAEVEIQSAPGHGTSVRVTLPLTSSHPDSLSMLTEKNTME